MKHSLTRRELFTFSPSLPAAEQTPAAPPRGGEAARLVPRGDLVNTLEYEKQAQRVLAPAAYEQIAGGDRAAFDRMTLRPRMNVPTTGLDLTVDIFGTAHFAPILVAPIADQGRFHADGELATARGTSAGQATMIVSSASSKPLQEVVGASTTPPWFQVFAADNRAAEAAEQAVGLGCKAVVVTVGATAAPASSRTPARLARIAWPSVGTLIRAVKVPVIVKGVTSPEMAVEALARGAQGVVVSTYGGLVDARQPAAITLLTAVVDQVAGKAPVLVDGSFRRGTDIVKALALGATAVLVGRPVMWGLAAYGADGVQGVVEMLQTETARYMAMCGRPNLKSLERTVVKIHTR